MDRVFDPSDVQIGHSLGKTQGVIGIPGEKAVDHDRHTVAGGLGKPPHQGDIGLKTVLAGLWPIGRGGFQAVERTV